LLVQAKEIRMQAFHHVSLGWLMPQAARALSVASPAFPPPDIGSAPYQVDIARSAGNDAILARRGAPIFGPLPDTKVPRRTDVDHRWLHLAVPYPSGE
jgi:hypothetical protein